MKAFLLLLPLPLLVSSCSLAGPPFDEALEKPSTLRLPVSSGPLDLATTLRLAGARDIDVEFARQRLIEARGDHESERLRYFPTLRPGIGFQHIEGRVQDTGGKLLDVSKQNYSANVAIVAELNLGETIYRELAAKRTAEARAEGVRVHRLEAMLEAGLAFYDLAFATDLEVVSRDAVALNEDQEKQLNAAIDAGVALKTDLLRIRVQKRSNQMRVREAGELADIASARLAETLRLPAAMKLRTSSRSLSPVEMVVLSSTTPATLVVRAQSAHPAVAEAAALTAAAERSRDAVVLGPLVPTLTAASIHGGLGGGTGSDFGNFGDRHEAIIGLSWRIGAGGLFDTGRNKAAEARLEQSRLSEDKVREHLARLVTEAHASALSASDRLKTARTLLDEAGQVAELSNDRKKFGVGVVLEMIEATEELILSRQQYLQSIADWNKAQLALAIYTGRLGTDMK